MAIVPTSDALPEEFGPGAQTTNYDAGEDTLSVSYLKYPEPEDWHSLELRLAVEACQQRFDFLPVEILTSGEIKDIVIDPNNLNDIRLKFLAQDLGCNSYGIAIGSRAKGRSYEEYKSHIENTLYNNKGANDSRPILINEDVYTGSSSTVSLNK